MSEHKVLETVDSSDWWPCACVKGGSVKHRRPSTHIKLHHPSVKKCRVCGITKEDSDRAGQAEGGA